MDYFDDRFNRFEIDQSSYNLTPPMTKKYPDAFASDYNYEYDRFPKDFKFTRRFMGVSNGTELDKFYTESYLTNRVKNIEKTYVGSDELPETYVRKTLPQKGSEPCQCSKCKPKILNDYIEKLNISKAIEELQNKNDMLTLILLFIVIYCVVQMLMGPLRIIDTELHLTTDSMN